MKLALVTETYPPEVNGVAMTLSRLVTGLRSCGHEVEVVRPRQAKEAPGSEPTGGDWLVPGMAIPFYDSLRIGLPSVSRLERRWREQPPDVVHVATEGPLGLASLLAARRLGLPVTSSFHTNFHAYGGHYGMGLLRGAVLGYLRWFHNRTRRTLAPTQQMVNDLSLKRFERLGVMARGVDTTLFDPARRSEELRTTWGAAPGDPVVLYVGRIAAEKNLGLAVDAFLKLREAEPHARFVLVGDGPAKAELAAAHPEFHYAGMRRGPELAEHYASGDLFFFASVTETFGNVTPEAMASGLPVLAYGYAAAAQLIRSGQNGLLATYNDAAEFCRLAVQMAADPSLAASMGAAARATAERLDWDSVLDQVEALFQQVVRDGGGDASP